MESVRSKKVRSRRTPVANLASFAPRESDFLRTGIDRVPQRHAPRPSRRSACASRNRTFFAPRHPAIASPLPHSSADPPPGYPRPGKHTGAHPSARGKGPSSAPVSAPPRRYAPLCEHPPNIRRGVLRTAAPHHVPTRRPALRLKGRTLVPRLRQPPPPLALIELQSHPRRSDEIAIHPRIAEALPKFAFHPFQKRVNGVA